MAKFNNNRQNRGNQNDRNQNAPVVEVVSNYNFVPAPEADQVYTVDWADQVSHDIPFSDGQSGEIEIEIEAKTPIFIRNGHAEGEEDNTFSHITLANGEKKYFIPATSIKGMLRNTLEIMSFSKMQQIERDTFYGLRDLNNIEYKSATSQNQIKSGWLKKEGDLWRIYPVEHGRISKRDVERQFNLPNNSIERAENAIKKYNSFGTNNINNRFSFERDLIKITNNRNLNYGKLYKFDNKGSVEGELVFYGEIGNKHYDYIFQKESQQFYTVDSQLIKNTDKLEGDGTLWKFFRDKTTQRIPVFFRTENDGGKEVVKHFGMSKLYRMNNGHSIGDFVPKYDKSKLDLSEVIFGFTDSDKFEPLKGRIFISNSKFSKNANTLDSIDVVLNNPKASYFPFYLKQSANESYKTYINPVAKLRGYKKYPVHKNKKESVRNGENEKITSTITPLSSGTSFKFKLRYFNLKPIEIGAILSALTFHGNHDKLFHSLGGAKPLGYGKVKLSTVLTDEHKGFMQVFEKEMNSHCNVRFNKNWIETDTIKELFAMASEPQNDTVDAKLRYPMLERPNVPARDANEFVNFKNPRSIKFLLPYSESNINQYNIIKKVVDDEAKFFIESKIKAEEAERKKIKDAEALAKAESQAAEEAEYQKALITEDLDLIKKYIEENPFRVGIEEVRRRYNQLKPTEIPIRLKEGRIPFKNFIKEAKDWKKKSPDAFDALRKDLEKICKENYDQSLEIE